MMQENRSFDHYFGTLRGVRGYGDNRTINLSNGSPVWYQPNGGGYLLPFHPGAPNLGLQFIEDYRMTGRPRTNTIFPFSVRMHFSVCSRAAFPEVARRT
jgi:hypothetical protein